MEDLVTPLRERFDLRWDAELIARELRALGLAVKRPWLAGQQGGKAVRAARLSVVLGDNAETLERQTVEHGLECHVPAQVVSAAP